MRQKKQWVIAMFMAVMTTAVWTGMAGSAQAKECGVYPSRPGTILVTPDNQNKMARVFNLGHAAIVLNKSTVVEAALPHVTTSKNAWRSRAQVRKVYGLSVRKTSPAQDKKAAKWCRKQVGKPYNFNYTNVKTRKKFYCSQLVWAAFKDNCKINLDTAAFGKMVAPMELVNSNKTDLIYTYSS